MDMDHTTQDTSPTAAVENDEHGQLPSTSTSFTADAGNLEVSSPPSAGNVVLPVPVANNNLTQNFTESELSEIFGEGGLLAVCKRKLEQFRIQNETFRLEVEQLRVQFELLKRFRRSSEQTIDWRLDGRRGPAASENGPSAAAVQNGVNGGGGGSGGNGSGGGGDSSTHKRKRWGKRSSIRRHYR